MNATIESKWSALLHNCALKAHRHRMHLDFEFGLAVQRLMFDLVWQMQKRKRHLRLSSSRRPVLVVVWLRLLSIASSECE